VEQSSRSSVSHGSPTLRYCRPVEGIHFAHSSVKAVCFWRMLVSLRGRIHGEACAPSRNRLWLRLEESRRRTSCRLMKPLRAASAVQNPILQRYLPSRSHREDRRDQLDSANLADLICRRTRIADRILEPSTNARPSSTTRRFTILQPSVNDSQQERGRSHSS